LATKRKQAMN